MNIFLSDNPDVMVHIRLYIILAYFLHKNPNTAWQN